MTLRIMSKLAPDAMKNLLLSLGITHQRQYGGFMPIVFSQYIMERTLYPNIGYCAARS